MTQQGGTASAEVIDLRTRGQVRPNLAQLAQQEVSRARQILGLTRDEFAGALEPLLGWRPETNLIEAWEERATPPGDVLLAVGIAAEGQWQRGQSLDALGQAFAHRYADVAAVYSTRSEFAVAYPPGQILGEARHIRMVGLSLNLLVQHFADQELRENVEAGSVVQCLFLDPGGHNIQLRETEEGMPAGTLSTLTQINIQTLTKRVRDRLTNEAAGSLELGTYEEVLRFNVLLVDEDLCIAQPYLAVTRGIDSPTFVIERRRQTRGLFDTFESMFGTLWENRRPL